MNLRDVLHRTQPNPKATGIVPTAAPTIDDPAPASMAIFTAGATATYRKPDESQDRWGRAVLQEGRGAAVVVCDGVGSQPDSGPVADAAVNAAVAHLAQADPDTAIEGVIGEVDRAVHAGPPLDGNTTVLVAVAHSVGQIDIAFVGNGAIFEITGVMVSEDHARLRWVNHALPHVDQFEALTNFVGPTAPAATPAIASFLPPPTEMRLVLACTDGIATGETSKVGHTPDGGRWLSISPELLTLVTAIEEAWPQLTTAPAGDVDELLSATLDVPLRELAEGAHLEDDATIAAILLRPASQPTHGTG